MHVLVGPRPILGARALEDRGKDEAGTRLLNGALAAIGDPTSLEVMEAVYKWSVHRGPGANYRIIDALGQYREDSLLEAFETAYRCWIYVKNLVGQQLVRWTIEEDRPVAVVQNAAVVFPPYLVASEAKTAEPGSDYATFLSKLMASQAERSADPDPVGHNKRVFDFANWSGKDGSVRDGFKVDPSILPAGQTLGEISEPSVTTDRNTGGLVVSRQYKLTGTSGTPHHLTIYLTVAETCAAALGGPLWGRTGTRSAWREYFDSGSRALGKRSA